MGPTVPPGTNLHVGKKFGRGTTPHIEELARSKV